MGDVFWLREVGRDDVAVAGGKGANLGALTEAGFPVPPGYVVAAHACNVFFEKINATADIAELSSGATNVADICHRLARRIRETDLPAELEADIRTHHDELAAQRGGEVICAVRSSATAEDLGDASFAGQHGTYYYVDDQRLIAMIKNCWASLWTEEAVSYRETQGIDHGSVYMAVVVQEMIKSEVAGVTFTVNPVSGDRTEIVTESSWGMGAAIVDGRVTPITTWWIAIRSRSRSSGSPRKSSWYRQCCVRAQGNYWWRSTLPVQDHRPSAPAGSRRSRAGRSNARSISVRLRTSSGQYSKSSFICCNRVRLR